jgi:hypothetical protein
MSFMGVQMAKHNLIRTAADVEDKATTVRPPSTANFVLDSNDREQYAGSGTSTNFTINKSNSLFNGFFTRIAMTEITLEWCIPNISAGYEPANNTLTVDLGGVRTITLPDGHYTIADALDTIVALLNTEFGAGTFRVEDKFGNAWSSTSFGDAFLATTGGANFTINQTLLAQQLGLQIGGTTNSYPLICPRLLPIYYIDFVSPQMTYNQELKDNSTSTVVRDVLYRWVFAYDNCPIPEDRYGYPIYQGYKPFLSRRYLTYPKQILWNPNQPIGQLSFQVYSSFGELFDPSGLGELEYQMGFLISEN